MACSLAMGWADNNYGKVDGLDFFSEYDETHNYAECQIFSEKYSKWWLHAEKYAQAAKRNVTLGRFAVFSDKVTNKEDLFNALKWSNLMDIL